MVNEESELIIRELASIAEFKDAEVFQQTVWGDEDKPDNADILLAVQHAGGLVTGVYHEDYYGEMEGINAGAPSGRLVAEWQLLSPRVLRRAGQVRSKPVPEAEHHVIIPANFTEMLSQDLDSAVSERLRVRTELQNAFASGHRIVGFDKVTSRYSLILTCRLPSEEYF